MPHSVVPSVSEETSPIFVRYTSYFERKSTLPMARQSLALPIVIAMMPGRATLCGAAHVRYLTVKNVLRCQEA
jgi:hypothetical protein